MLVIDWSFSVDRKYQDAVISEVKEPAQRKALAVVTGSLLLLPFSKHQLIRTDESKKQQKIILNSVSI